MFVQHSSGHHRQLMALRATTDECNVLLTSLLERGVHSRSNLQRLKIVVSIQASKVITL